MENDLLYRIGFKNDWEYRVNRGVIHETHTHGYVANNLFSSIYVWNFPNKSKICKKKRQLEGYMYTTADSLHYTAETKTIL